VLLIGRKWQWSRGEWSLNIPRGEVYPSQFWVHLHSGTSLGLADLHIGASLGLAGLHMGHHMVCVYIIGLPSAHNIIFI
jgi:hypothetical protein